MRKAWARWRGFWYKVKYQWLLRRAVMRGVPYAYCELEIKGPGKVLFQEGVRLMPTAFGEDHVSLYLNRRDSRIFVGRGAVLRGTRVGCESVVEIGERAVVEGASLFDTDFHNIDASKRDVMERNASKPLIIGGGAYVGWECCIGKGAALGPGAVVLPKTVLTWKSVPADAVLFGVPGRLLP
jgi:hypothetical protein